MRTFLLLTALTIGASAQTRDAFTGTWKLNIEKSRFSAEDEVFSSGFRTYTPTAKGTRVSWNVTDRSGKPATGKYEVICKNRHCISDPVYWKVRDERTVEGEMFTNGALEHRYTRTVSPDGNTMTITLYLPGKSEPSSIQVWERQPSHPK